MAKYVDPEKARDLMRAAGVEPLEPYPGAKVGWRVRCLTCGSEGRPWYSTVKAGVGACNTCARRATAEKQRSRGFETAIRELRSSGWHLLTPREDYTNAKGRVLVSCQSCGTQRFGIGYQLKTSKCDCKKSARRPLAVDFPKLAAELHPLKNLEIPLQRIGSGMRTNVWWICPQGHEYQATPANRVGGTGCTFCAGQAVLAGFNDLKSQAPLIAAEWHPRNSVDSSQVHVGSNKVYWWQCPVDSRHIYNLAPSERLSGTNCPVCAGKRVISGVNDLATTKPNLAAEWHPTLNGILKPTEVVASSNKRAVWQCRKNINHVWETSISGRKGCPYCAGQRGDPENNLFSRFPELEDIWDFDSNALDPRALPPGSARFARWKCKSNPKHRYRRKINAQIRYGGCPICSGVVVQSGVNDLLTEYPRLKEILDPNDLETAMTIRPASHARLRWICSKNPSHRWIGKAKDALRYGCGFCDGRWITPGVNDLASTHPHLAKEWHRSKNEIQPSEIRSTSNSMAFWQCQVDQAHVWKAIVSSRARGNNCPYCSNQKILSGNNDFATAYPGLAAQRIPRKGEPEPHLISKGSKVKYLWQCANFSDHTWEASVSQRVTHSTGCPICRNLVVKTGFNDLATTHPQVALDWHPIKNEELRPTNVIAGSHTKVWWQCSNLEDHVFLQSIRDHVMGRGCYVCVPRGFRPSRPSKFYFIENEDLGAYKIGITNINASSDRLAKWTKLGWEVIEVIDFSTGYQILALETETLRWLRREKKLPVFLEPKDLPRIGGFSETFAMEAINREEVMTEIAERWARLKKLNPEAWLAR